MSHLKYCFTNCRIDKLIARVDHLKFFSACVAAAPVAAVAIIVPVLLIFLESSATVDAQIHNASVTISGQSAGGGMAVNMLFAYSSIVSGAAIAAGNPYVAEALLTRRLRAMWGCFLGK